jgi:hypothetical protein
MRKVYEIVCFVLKIKKFLENIYKIDELHFYTSIWNFII